MADFMRRCKGKVMVRINDHPGIRRVFEGFYFETIEIRYTTTNQRQGRDEVNERHDRHSLCLLLVKTPAMQNRALKNA